MQAIRQLIGQAPAVGELQLLVLREGEIDGVGRAGVNDVLALIVLGGHDGCFGKIVGKVRRGLSIGNAHYIRSAILQRHRECFLAREGQKAREEPVAALLRDCKIVSIGEGNVLHGGDIHVDAEYLEEEAERDALLALHAEGVAVVGEVHGVANRVHGEAVRLDLEGVLAGGGDLGGRELLHHHVARGDGGRVGRGVGGLLDLGLERQVRDVDLGRAVGLEALGDLLALELDAHAHGALGRLQLDDGAVLLGLDEGDVVEERVVLGVLPRLVGDVLVQGVHVGVVVVVGGPGRDGRDAQLGVVGDGVGLLDGRYDLDVVVLVLVGDLGGRGLLFLGLLLLGLRVLGLLVLGLLVLGLLLFGLLVLGRLLLSLLFFVCLLLVRLLGLVLVELGNSRSVGHGLRVFGGLGLNDELGRSLHLAAVDDIPAIDKLKLRLLTTEHVDHARNLIASVGVRGKAQLLACRHGDLCGGRSDLLVEDV